MDSQNLHLNIDFVGSSGVILSPEQKASLQTSLVILKNNHKFAQVKLWGKILGVKDDYYIAQGFTDDQFAEKTTLYSKDCVNWGLLSHATEETLKKARIMTGRFIGDPSYECEHREVTKVVQKGQETEEETVTILKEEDRLAAVIADIDHDVKIAPRTAFVQSPNGKIYENRSFEGLNVSEAAKLCNYMHMRKAENSSKRTAIRRANFDKSVDFMDCLEDDIPKGSWSLQFERGSGQVTLRSLLWLGYTFFHVPESRIYGGIYVGNGERNIDLPFML